METRRDKHFQNCDPPLDLHSSSKTLSEPLRNSVHETLGSFDFDENSSTASNTTFLDNNGNSDYDSLLEEPDLEQETVLTDDTSPIKRRSYTHWAEPWSGIRVQKPAADTLSLAAPEEHRLPSPDWTDMPPSEELQIKPSVPPLLTEYERHHVVIFFIELLFPKIALNFVENKYALRLPRLFLRLITMLLAYLSRSLFLYFLFFFLPNFHFCPSKLNLLLKFIFIFKFIKFEFLHVLKFLSFYISLLYYSAMCRLVQ